MTFPVTVAGSALSSIPLKTLYTRLLLTHLVDSQLQAFSDQGYIDAYASCRGHEAAQVGSAICIEVGQDFTLPYYRDLGVVLTIGMTPYEAIRTCLNTYTTPIASTETYSSQSSDEFDTAHTADIPHPSDARNTQNQPLQWSYHKHNIVHGNASSATHILHAAGIAFASKLRKVSAVTVVYCGDGATKKPDFLEGIRFSAQHHLPVVFICERECLSLNDVAASSCFVNLPEGLTHQRIDGRNVALVYETMQHIIQRVRAGAGPILLEVAITRSTSHSEHDPLTLCEQMLRSQGLWDDTWATQLHTRLQEEVKQAAQNALLDVLPSRE